jgi:hypothetical protein
MSTTAVYVFEEQAVQMQQERDSKRLVSLRMVPMIA